MSESDQSGEDRVHSAVRSAIISLSSEVRPCDLTVTAVCREAGISRGAFYNHYSGIDEAVDGVLDHILRSADDGIPYRCINGDGEYNCPYGICDIVIEHPE